VAGHEAEAELGFSYDVLDSVFKLYFDRRLGMKAVLKVEA